MFEDLLRLGVLLGLGALVQLVLRVRRRRSRVPGPARAPSGRRSDRWRVLTHPCSQLVLSLTVVLAAAWGVHAAHRSSQGGSMTDLAQLSEPPGQAQVCRRVQREVHRALVYRLRTRLVVLQRGEPLPSAFEASCPCGGRYSIDEDGYLSCSLHGRALGLPSLVEGRAERP